MTKEQELMDSLKSSPDKILKTMIGMQSEIDQLKTERSQIDISYRELVELRKENARLKSHGAYIVGEKIKLKALLKEAVKVIEESCVDDCGVDLTKMFHDELRMVIQAQDLRARAFLEKVKLPLIKVQTDLSTPEGEIHFTNTTGEVVGKIINIDNDNPFQPYQKDYLRKIKGEWNE